MCNLNLIGPVVSEEKMFEIVDGRTTERQQTQMDKAVYTAKAYVFSLFKMTYFYMKLSENLRGKKARRKFPSHKRTCY